MSQNTPSFSQNTRVNPRRVFFTGTTALERGQSLCYDRDRGTAANVDGTRDQYVELPSSTNNRWFAGVCANDYVANASGQWIEIYEPGSVCQISTLIATTVASTRLTAMAGGGNAAAGKFVPIGLPGRGSALALQTVAVVTGPTDYSVAPISNSLDGSATYTSASLTVTKTGAFANVPATANLQGNEYIVVLAGAQDNVGSGASITPTAGRYLISSKTSDDAVVVSSAIATANCDIAFYCVRGNPLVLAQLDEGPESGMVQYLSLYTDGSGTTAVAAMVGGETRIFGGFDLDVGDTVDTLADGDQPGLLKRFHLLAAITTNDHLITVATGVQLDGSTSLGSMEFDGADDRSVLQWFPPHWKLMANSGTGLA